MPSVLEPRKIARGADERGHVHIMAAGVHDPDLLAGGILGSDAARVRQTGLFGNRQRIHIRSYQQSWTRPIIQHRDDAVCLRPIRIPADPFCYLVSGFPKFVR